MKMPIYLSILSLAFTAPSFAAYECSQEITRTTAIEGTAQIPISKYTLAELCSSRTFLGKTYRKDCRKELREDMDDFVEYYKELKEHFGDGIASQILDPASNPAQDVFVSKNVNDIVDFLLSNQKIKMTAKETSKVHLGPVQYVEYRAMNEPYRPGANFYRVYPNLEYEFSKKRAAQFRVSLGGGLTEDLGQIYSAEIPGNFSTGQTIEWYTGEWSGPQIHTAIVRDQLVITLQKSLGKVVSVMTYPIPLAQKREIPFTTTKKMNGFDVKMDAQFSIHCRQK